MPLTGVKSPKGFTLWCYVVMASIRMERTSRTFMTLWQEMGSQGFIRVTKGMDLSRFFVEYTLPIRYIIIT